MPDSPRWCASCKAWGNHHTDRHDEHTPDGLPSCDRCGDPTEDNDCDHGLVICADCADEGACVLCARERAEDIADDIATERALDEWRGVSA